MITRPQFIALYFDQPDSSAHEYGPHSLQVCIHSNVDLIIFNAGQHLLQM